jgi:hypothetical protein
MLRVSKCPGNRANCSYAVVESGLHANDYDPLTRLITWAFRAILA